MMISRILYSTVIAAVCALGAAQGCRQEPARVVGTDRADRVRELYLAALDRLDSMIVRFQSSVASRSGDEARARFSEARMIYKEVEYLAEFHSPVTAGNINGPALERMEEDDPTRVIAPQGFQVIEESLFPTLDTAELGTMLSEAKVLRANVRRLRNHGTANRFTDTQIFHALRTGIIRVIALGLTGFDSPVALQSLPEAVAALEGLRRTLSIYEPELRTAAPALWHRIDTTLRGAIGMLDKGEFDRFDRLAFIVEFADPLSGLLLDAQRALGIPLFEGRLPLNPAARTVFDSGAFDPYAYAPSYVDRGNPARVELGRTLFFDPILSGNGRRACASCHRPEQALSDGETRSLAFDAAGRVRRNAPTLINAALQSALFYDQRVMFLEDQATDVLTNPVEMHGSLKDAVEKLAGSEQYVVRFAAAFPKDAENGVNERNMRIALAAYLRSLIALDAPFDRYMRGEPGALSDQARQGFNLFAGKAKCGTCHFLPLFGGVVPPEFVETESEILGVPEDPHAAAPVLDNDEGRFGATRLETHRFAFKTPSLRNVELTAPYMHNGAYATLEEVVRFYNHGGGAGMGLNVPRQTLPQDSLRLSGDEQRALIAFMRALTDTTGTGTRPAALPALAVSDRRSVGGSY